MIKVKNVSNKVLGISVMEEIGGQPRVTAEPIVPEEEKEVPDGAKESVAFLEGLGLISVSKEAQNAPETASPEEKGNTTTEAGQGLETAPKRAGRGKKAAE